MDWVIGRTFPSLTGLYWSYPIRGLTRTDELACACIAWLEAGIRPSILLGPLEMKGIPPASIGSRRRPRREDSHAPGARDQEGVRGRRRGCRRCGGAGADGRARAPARD